MQYLIKVSKVDGEQKTMHVCIDKSGEIQYKYLTDSALCNPHIFYNKSKTIKYYDNRTEAREFLLNKIEAKIDEYVDQSILKDDDPKKYASIKLNAIRNSNVCITCLEKITLQHEYLPWMPATYLMGHTTRPYNIVE